MAEPEETWRLPEVVQELATSVKEIPSQYVLREQDRHGVLLVANHMPEPIPVIDLNRLLADVEEADKLQAALQGWGLFLVINHGIETSLMDDVMHASNEFFGQPLEEKQKYRNLIDGKHFQVEGYGNDEVKTQDQTLDWSDRLHLRVGPEDERNLANWPKHPESFRFALQEYTSKCRRIKHIILRAMARLLKLDEGYFLNQFSGSAPTTVRINHYVPCPRPNLVLGFKAHSDDGVLAILLVDNDVSALQVLKDEIWYNVPTNPGNLLINIGDFMEGDVANEPVVEMPPPGEGNATITTGTTGDGGSVPESTEVSAREAEAALGTEQAPEGSVDEQVGRNSGGQA